MYPMLERVLLDGATLSKLITAITGLTGSSSFVVSKLIALL